MSSKFIGMKLESVILVSLVFVARIQISYSAETNSSLITSSDHRKRLPIQDDDKIDVYYIKGQLNKENVKYPAVLIDKHTLVTAGGDPIQTPMICLKDDCVPPTNFTYQRRYAFWTGVNKIDAIVPEKFTGTITGAKCTLNDGNAITTFKHIKSKDAFTCSGECKVNDVVICDNKIAGFLEKTNKPNSFIFRDITNILQNNNFIPKHGFNIAHLKLFTVKYRENKQQRAFAAIAIDPNTLVSYRRMDVSRNPVKVCDRQVCFTPLKTLRRSPYIFWKTDKAVAKSTIRFFRGNITTSKCNLNGFTHNVTFKLFSARKRKFLCEPRCKQSDFVLCNRKIAGFLTKTMNVFKIDTMWRVLKLAGNFRKIDPENTRKLTRNKRKLNPHNAAITTKKVHVTPAESNVSDQPAAATRGGGKEVADADNATKSNAREASKNQTSVERRQPSEAKDQSGSKDVEKSTSEPKDRKEPAATNSTLDKESKQMITGDEMEAVTEERAQDVGGDQTKLKAGGGPEDDMEGKDEEDPTNREGKLPDDPEYTDEEQSEIPDVVYPGDEEDMEEEESPRVDEDSDEAASDSEESYDDEMEQTKSVRIAQPRVVKSTTEGLDDIDDPLTPTYPTDELALRDLQNLANMRSSCILINVPVAIVLFFVNV